jgi:hypothetical protein
MSNFLNRSRRVKNYNRKSRRINRNRSRRQNGGLPTPEPPPPPAPPAAPKVSEKPQKVLNLGNLSTGSLCNDQNEKDCKIMPACQWMPKTKHCQRKSGLGNLVFNEDSKNVKGMRQGEAKQLQQAREAYLESKKQKEPLDVDTSLVPSKGAVAEPMNVQSSAARESSEASRPRLQSQGCVINAKSGRCVKSDTENDSANCYYNEKTGRCRKK